MSKNPVPQGMYKPAVRFGDLIFTAGMTPRKDGVLLSAAKLTIADQLDPEAHRREVRQAAENCLEEGEKIVQILSLTVYINADPRFTKHPRIADLASEYLVERLGPDAGIGARAAVGVASLPGNAPVEIQLIAAAGKA